MRKIIIFVSTFVIIIIACQNSTRKKQVLQINTPYVSIKIDTIELDTKDCLMSVVKHNDKYYFLSQEDDYSGSEGKYYLTVTDSNYNSIYQTIAPERYHTLQLQVKNDSIIVKNTFNEIFYYLNLDSLRWDTINPGIIPIYEDENFRITSNCSGEFGGTIFFNDKNTNLRYEGQAVCASIINKINNVYYLTNFMPHMTGNSHVVEIPDPRKMFQSDASKNERNYSDGESISRQGMNTLFYLDNPIPIASFVHKNRLLHMCSFQDSITCIAEFRDNKLRNVLTLNAHIYPEIQQQLANKYQIYSFFTVNPFEFFDSEQEPNINFKILFGFIEITHDEIYIHYIKPIKQE